MILHHPHLLSLPDRLQRVLICMYGTVKLDFHYKVENDIDTSKGRQPFCDL